MHGPRNFDITSGRFNSHLYHGPQATYTKVKRGESEERRVIRGFIMIQIKKFLLLRKNGNKFEHRKMYMVGR